MRFSLIVLISFLAGSLNAQWHWQNMDSAYQPLPASMHVYRTNDSTDGKPNIAYYVSVDLKDPHLDIVSGVGKGKRFTPSEYFEKEGRPLLVMNCTFFEFVHNSNQNIVVKDGKLEAYQVHSIPARGKDTFTYRHAFGSAIGIDKHHRADVAWLYTDSASEYPYASQSVVAHFGDSVIHHTQAEMLSKGSFRKWKMKTAVGGGPVLLQQGELHITNNEELKFTGKAIIDKHPRTAMGYTRDGKLIFLVIEGRFPNKAEGATLTQEAQMLQQLGCLEALNLDGGGSSSLLINGKPTITPSDKEGQRPVPAVIMVKGK
ncbi:MAG: phosphodiester glycosidase family protein [Chitinophagaceae bacterium]|nr:phosphodiester glycosidase family protein [Chitinophagaceae bacterium]